MNPLFQGQKVHYTVRESPLGTILVAATSKGVCFLEFASNRDYTPRLKKLMSLFGENVTEETNEHLNNIIIELDEYFQRKRQVFETPLDVYGSNYQKKVWKTICDVGYGETITYGEQARRIGDVEMVREVARTNGCNRIAILIPCHRIIGAKGKLTGYGAGLWRKKWLLELEGVLPLSIF